MSSTSRLDLILVVALAALLNGCETSKPEGGLARTSAKPSAAAAADQAGAATDSPTRQELGDTKGKAHDECAALADHITEIQFTRIRQLPEEQRQRYEQSLPQIKQQITNDCTARWPDEFKQCIGKADSEDAFTDCVRNHAPRPPTPNQPPPEAGPACDAVANHVIEVAQKSPSLDDATRKILPQLRAQIEAECSSNKMPANVRACLMTAGDDAAMKKCAPMLLAPRK